MYIFQFIHLYNDRKNNSRNKELLSNFGKYRKFDKLRYKNNG